MLLQKGNGIYPMNDVDKNYYLFRQKKISSFFKQRIIIIYIKDRFEFEQCHLENEI
jgi:hypothetical protein